MSTSSRSRPCSGASRCSRSRRARSARVHGSGNCASSITSSSATSRRSARRIFHVCFICGRSRVVKLATASASRKYNGNTTSSGSDVSHPAPTRLAPTARPGRKSVADGSLCELGTVAFDAVARERYWTSPRPATARRCQRPTSLGRRRPRESSVVEHERLGEDLTASSVDARHHVPRTPDSKAPPASISRDVTPTSSQPSACGEGDRRGDADAQSREEARDHGRRRPDRRRAVSTRPHPRVPSWPRSAPRCDDDRRRRPA